METMVMESIQEEVTNTRLILVVVITMDKLIMLQRTSMRLILQEHTLTIRNLLVVTSMKLTLVVVTIMALIMNQVTSTQLVKTVAITTP